MKKVVALTRKDLSYSEMLHEVQIAHECWNVITISHSAYFDPSFNQIKYSLLIIIEQQ